MTNILATAVKAITSDSTNMLASLDKHTPGLVLHARLGYLQLDIESGKRVNKYRMIMTTEELETLASAVAICDWIVPETTVQDINAIRFILVDHLGVKNI